jgi:hypothetical protein
MNRAARALALVLLVGVSSAGAQDSASTVLPLDVAREVVRLFNATAALRTVDKTTIERGRTIQGDVATLNGPLLVAGHVTGRVLAVNSDVILDSGAVIDGDLILVGGELEGRSSARIGGEIRVYHAPLRYTQQGDQLVADESDGAEEPWWRLWERRGHRNFNRLEVATAGVYNRVEGLPVRVGPTLYRDQGWGYFRLGAAAILRSASSFTSSTADVGHDVRGEIRLGREYGVSVGGQLFQLVTPVESWQLGNDESGLATFLFHRDYRDYFARHGGKIHAALRATDNADLTLAYTDERWSSRDERNPLAFNFQDVAWRENPHVDDGRFHVASLTLRVDTRNDVFTPLAGWYLLADYERGTGKIDALGASSSGVRAAAGVPTRYIRGFLDLRRYNRLAPNSSLNLRVVLGGWLSGDPLPLERRLSIDGPGTIPGFDFRTSRGAMDVGTCATALVPGTPAQCERISLAQMEYRTNMRFSRTVGRPGERQQRFAFDGDWVFFADAGRGWTVNAPGSPLNFRRSELPPLSSYRTDIGAGLDFGYLGIYAAKSLSTPQEPANLFLRVRHRF